MGVSFFQPIYTTSVTALGTVRILDEIKKFDSKIKFYQASSSEMYGNQKLASLNEKSTFNPASPYAISKLYGFWTVNLYREPAAISMNSLETVHEVVSGVIIAVDLNSISVPSTSATNS